jgi:3-isopropylmalate dehydrogenase
MAEKITILETKLEQFVGEGYTAEELKVVTTEIKLDALLEARNTAKRPKPKVKITNDGSGGDERKVLPINKKLLMLPGDGIGSEVMHQVKRIIEWMDKARHVSIDITEGLVGGACYDKHGCSITDQTMADALNADAVLVGAVGGPKWDKVKREDQPEQALLRFRKELDLFANLRPAFVYPALAEFSSLKKNRVAGLDLLIIRELTSGVYLGESHGIEDLSGGEKPAIHSSVYTPSEIERVCRLAFEIARKRQMRVTSVEKGNVTETATLWREIVSAVHSDGYSDVKLSHLDADNCAKQLVRQPEQFDLIVTDKHCGKILSGCAAMLTGPVSMLPSASLGSPNKSGRRKAMYGPVHGTAPDIAGQNKANPLAMILSYAMCLRYSFEMVEDANLLEIAVQKVLEGGLRTGDIMQSGMTLVSCEQMGGAVITELKLMEQGFCLE